MVKDVQISYHLRKVNSEKATKFCKISTVDLSYVEPVKSTVEISQNFVASSEYMNFTKGYVIYANSKLLCTKCRIESNLKLPTTFGLAYSPLNSAKLSYLSEVTSKTKYLDISLKRLNNSQTSFVGHLKWQKTL